MTTNIKNLLAFVTSECTAIDREAHFDSMLDECYTFEKVGGPFEYMTPSRVLKEMDPTAYRCGVNDFADGEGWVEIDSESYDSDEVEKAREQFVSDLESEASDLESEIEELEYSNDEAEENAGVIAGLKIELADKQAEIIEAQKYTF